MRGSDGPTTGVTVPFYVRLAGSASQFCVDELRSSGFNEFDEEETRVTVLEASGTRKSFVRMIRA